MTATLVIIGVLVALMVVLVITNDLEDQVAPGPLGPGPVELPSATEDVGHTHSADALPPVLPAAPAPAPVIRAGSLQLSHLSYNGRSLSARHAAAIPCTDAMCPWCLVYEVQEVLRGKGTAVHYPRTEADAEEGFVARPSPKLEYERGAPGDREETHCGTKNLRRLRSTRYQARGMKACTWGKPQQDAAEGWIE